MGISVWQLAIVLAIVLLLFGTKKLRHIGGDLGSAIRSFRGAVKEGNDEADKLNSACAEPLQQSAENESEVTTAKASTDEKTRI